MQSNFIEITLRHGCSPVNLLHIFRTPFPRNTSGWVLLKVSRELFQKTLKTFAFKILRFAEYRQLTKSCWGKKSMKRKTLHGIRYVNKKLMKSKTIQSCERDLLLFAKKLPEKETNNSKIVAFFSKLHETRQTLG